MSRKPRFLLHGESKQHQPGDVLLDQSGLIALCQYGPDYNACITRTETDPIDDPLDWYGDLISAFVARRWAMWISLDPYRSYTRERFPWVNRGWYALRIKYNNDRPVFRVMFTADDVTGQPLYLDQQTHIPSDTCLKDIDKEFETFLAPLRQLFVRIATIDSGMFRDVLEVRGLEFGKSFPVSRTQSVLQMVGPPRVVEHVYSGLDAVTARMSPVDRHYGYFVPPVRTDKSVDFAFLEKERLRKRPGFEMCWLHSYQIVTDAAIPLLAGIGLPPYVVLWIVDWLPRMDLWSHRKKIELIVRVRDSIEKVREARELAAHAKRTNKPV